MKKMQGKRVVAMILCMGLVAAGATGCGDSKNARTGGTDGEKPDKISVIGTTDDVAYFEYIGKQYKEKYGVDVEVISQSYDDTKTKITTSVTSGNADIAYLDVVWPAEFVEKGMLLELDDYYTDDLKENLLPGNLGQMTVEDRIYGVPYANNGTFMFYNQAMLEKAGYMNPPETWEELEQMSKKMQEQGICKYGIAWPGQQAEGSICNLSTLIYSFGGEWKKDDGTFDFNSDACVQAVEFMTGSIENGWADPSSVSYSDRDILDAFLAGDTAFVINWSYAYNVANDPSQSQVAGDVDICLVPGANGVRSAFCTGGGGLGILSTSKYPDYAWKYIEMLTEPQNQKHAFEEHAIMPTLKSVFEDPQVQKLDPALEKMYPQFEYPANRPAVANYSEWSNAVQVELSSIMVGNEKVKAGLDKACKISGQYE